MYELAKLRKILNPSIEVTEICLSYLTRFLPELKDSPCIILYKQRSPSETSGNQSTFIDDNDQTSQFDITGSPLKYSFQEDDFEDTIIVHKRNWYKEEEKYLPLNRTDACNALNTCLEHLTDAFPPIFAVCDGTDNKQSRLLGTIIEGEWFTTIEICSAGMESLNTIKKSSFNSFQQHLKLSHANEHDVTVSAFNTFDLFGIKEEMINWDENAKSNFEGCLSVDVDTCSLSLHPPTRATKNKLVAQIVTGSSSSPLNELWKQLLLLNEYLTIIEKYNESSRDTLAPLAFPSNFKSPYKEEHDTIMKNLNLLLNGDYSFRNLDNIDINKINFSNEENLENEAKIKQLIQNLPLRYNLDFTDFLWELLIKNSNYLEMTKCIHTVLEEIIISGCLTQVNFTNSTRFANVISNPHQHKMISYLLSGSLPLEYVIDMGFEKLCRDYTYILINARFGEVHDIQQKLGNVSSGEFTVDTYRKKLICMAQIHACLEFMLLVQDNLECPTEDLGSLFSCACKQYVCQNSPLQNYHDLRQNTIYSLTAPLPVSALIHLNEEILSTRRVTLSSQSKLSKLTTVKYYSRLPLFPTNIYPLDESNVMDEAYYVASAICSSNKVK